MSATDQLTRNFFAQPTLKVARALLGARLVHLDQGQFLAGIITETEAYIGEEDQGCHAKAGLTPRTQVMYGQPGTAYVYFTYGMHWMFNCVCEQVGFPAAVLIRSVQPTEGHAFIAARRPGQPQAHWTDGPAKLCQAFNIDGSLNGYDLCQPNGVLYIKAELTIPDSCVTSGPRVGLNNVPEPWKSLPWRFLAQLPSSV